MGNILTTSKKFISSNVIHYKIRDSVTRKKLVVITGCDSGLGYSLSHKCREWGFTVISGCFNTESDGAKTLSDNCHVYHLDVRNLKNISTFFKKVESMTKDDEYELHAVVNNAGIMIFGDFEWYTDQQILQQVEVNMLGYFRIAKAFLPLLKKYKGRLINVTSHCALANLPSLSVYGSTKAAIQSWSDGLRLEQAKYGVKIINVIPGSFISQSSIMAAQQSHLEEMEKNFSPEEKRFFGDYFQDFKSYILHVAGPKKHLTILNDPNLYKKFSEALFRENPKSTYKNEPWRYFFYYNALRISPFWLQDYLVKKFMKFPQFRRI